MPPPESLEERLEANLVTMLAEISAGATYWYTVNKVLRVDDFVTENLKTAHAGAPLDVIHQVLAGDEFPHEGTTGEFQKKYGLYVLAAKLWKPSSSSPYTIVAPIRRTIQNRLKRDIERRLYQDVSLLGLAENCEIKEINRSVYVDDTVLWAAIELRLDVSYSHQKATP